MPYVIGLLILIVLLLIFGPFVLWAILAILGIGGLTIFAMFAWLLKHTFWIVLGLGALFLIAFVVMYLMDPKGMSEAMKEAEDARKRREAFNATFKTSSFKKSKNR